jgi:arginyl-tRNA synthetase
MSSASNPFASAAAEAVASALGLDASLFVVGTPPKPEMGDFAVGCFPAAKALGGPPPKFAAQVVEAFAPTDLLASATAAGPFVNFRVNRAGMYKWLFDATLTDDGPELISTAIGQGKTICIDYSSPNISKQLGYHHIRSTVIGHALVNLYRAVGYNVVGINHLGDWGTTHGMLLAAYTMWADRDAELDIKTLNELYVRFRAEMKVDAGLEDDGRAWFKKLEDGDEEARTLWKKFRDVSWAEFNDVYETLDITFEEVKGESDYLDDMQPVIDMLESKGLTSISEGALVVAFDDEKTPPLLLRKQDGATLYATRDLAAAIYRWNEYAFERNLYVVDRGQGLHFKQLFWALTMSDHDWADKCAHVPFGLIRLGGKKAGTRTGGVVLLKDVMREAAERSTAKIRESNDEMTDDEVAETARIVGIGAVVFANLSSQREKDVDFEWESVLSTTGDSGPYIQYAHARCASILRKATESPDAAIDPALLGHDAEWAVARKLADMGEIVNRAADANEPHHVSRYLLDLCALFSRWFTLGNTDRSLRVRCEDAATQKARVTLVAAVRVALERGLALLGLGAPDKM